MTTEHINQTTADENVSPPSLKSLFSTDWEAPKEDTTSTYTQISVLGVIAFVVGLASFVAFLEVYGLAISVLGIILSLIAFILIVRSKGVLIGKQLAVLGLIFSIFTLSGVVAKWYYYQNSVRNEADRFCRIWFDAVKSKNLVLALEMTTPSWTRNVNKSVDEWWKSNLSAGETTMSNDEKISVFLSKLDARQLRALWFLGDRAVVTYYKTESLQFFDGRDIVVLVYAVTYTDSDGKPRTFFLKFSVDRVRNAANPYQVGWMMQVLPTFEKIPEELKK